MKKTLAYICAAAIFCTTFPAASAQAWERLSVDQDYFIEIEDLSLAPNSSIGAIKRYSTYMGLAVRFSGEMPSEMQIGDLSVSLYEPDTPVHTGGSSESAAYCTIYTYDDWMQRLRDAVAEYHETYFEIDGVLPKESILDVENTNTDDLYIAVPHGTLSSSSKIMAKALCQDGRFTYVGEAHQVSQVPAYLDDTVTAVCESENAAKKLTETLSQYYSSRDGEKVWFYRLYEGNTHYEQYDQAFETVQEARDFCDMLRKQDGVTDAACNYFNLENAAERRGEIILPNSLTEIYQPGDVDMNGVVNSDDSNMVLMEYLTVTVLGGAATFTEEEYALANVYPDNLLNADDSDVILCYYLYTMMGGDAMTVTEFFESGLYFQGYEERLNFK